MYIREERIGTQRVLSVIPNDNITYYFVECLFNYKTEGFIQTYQLANVIDVVRCTKDGTTSSAVHNRGHWFFDYESVCRWINERCDVDEKVIEENY